MAAKVASSIQVSGVANSTIGRMLGKAPEAAAKRINQLTGGVRDEGGALQRDFDSVTSTSEVMKLAEAIAGHRVSLPEARSVLQQGRAPRFLSDAEKSGAGFLSELVGDLSVKRPEPSTFKPNPRPVRLPKEYSLAQARARMLEKYPNGKLYLKENVDVDELLNRLFPDGGAITPQSLRFAQKPDGAGRTAPEHRLLSVGESQAAGLLYSTLFVAAPNEFSTEREQIPVAAFPGAEAVMRSTTRYELSEERGGPITATRTHELVIRAEPGTLVLFGQDLSIPKDGTVLTQTRTVGDAHEAVINGIDQSTPVAVHVLKPDPNGLLSPRVIGSFAVQLPEADAKSIAHAKPAAK